MLAMATSSLSVTRPLLLLLSAPLLLLLFSSSPALAREPHGEPIPAPLTYHGGPLLTGNVNLAIMWYGPFGRVQKSVVRSFVKSINFRGRGFVEPPVSSWWHIVESYQPTTGRRGPPRHGWRARRGALPAVPPINVTVVRQLTDPNCSVGKVLTIDFVRPLVEKASAAPGPKSTIVVVFVAQGVTVQGLCMGQCALHGVLGTQPYIVVGDPRTECPGSCAWPFYPSDYGPKGVTLQPPSGNVGADAMVVAFASALASTVTNPYNNTGYFGGRDFEPAEIASACPNMFGSGALPGYTGKVRVDPVSGGGFNTRGVRGMKFLLPALWNPATSSCWTPL